jgi:hypothetical protein
VDLDQYTALTTTPLGRSRLSAADIGGPDRTLAFGYTADRDTWHLYLAGGLLHRLVYDGRRGTVVHQQQSEVWATSNLVPGKRLYPESTDERFARLMRARGHDLRFRDFDARRHTSLRDRAFHGLVLDRRTGELVERTDAAVLLPATATVPVAERLDLIVDRDPDGPTEATLFRDGIEFTGVHVHVVDPGASGCGHRWLERANDLSPDTPAAVSAHVTLLTRTYHGTCDSLCEQEQEEDDDL